MNQTIKKVNQEKILFMDIEDVRRSKELDINSREFELYRKKTRNRETDEYLPNDEVVKEYQKKGALKMCYTKIVCIGVGFIKDGEVHIKSLEGTEEEVIRQFCTIAQNFDYMCFSNGIAFDLPSPKSDLDGSQVSDEYWNNGLEKISKYVKQDVFACVNLFKKMRFEQPFETFIDKNELTTVEPFTEEQPLLQKIYKATNISEETRKQIQERLSKKKVSKKDKEYLEDILSSLYVNSAMFSADKPEIKERKKQEIKEIING